MEGPSASDMGSHPSVPSRPVLRRRVNDRPVPGTSKSPASVAAGMTTDESALARELRADGIDVADVRASPDRIAVAFTTTLPGARPDHGEIGRVCNTVIDLVEAGELEPTRVEATSLRFEDDVQATWHVEAGWLEGLTSYRISEEEFSARVLDTVETEFDDDTGTDAPHATAESDDEAERAAGDGGSR